MVKDDETGEELNDIKLNLNSGKTGAKYITSTSTNKFGMGQFSNAAYDYYRVSFDGDTTYLP